MNVSWRLDDMKDSLPARKHGFRMSALDGVVLLLGTILTIWLRNEAFPLRWIVPMALGHFFLFAMSSSSGADWNWRGPWRS